MKKTTMFVAVVACLMVAMVSVSNAAITSPDWTYINSDGQTYSGSGDWSIGDLLIGDGGTASLTIDGVVLTSTWSVVGVGGSDATVTITGAGSVWHAVEGYWGSDGNPGIVNILDSGLFKVENTENHFTIGLNSAIQMTTDGQLAIKGALTTSLDDFLLSNSGYDNNLQYWNGSAWDRMSNGTEGVDYTLTDGTGDLEGYGILTAIVPEPATMSLLAIGGLALIRRRKRA